MTDQSKELSPLKKRADFLLMNKAAKRWVSHGLVIQAMPNDLGERRVGLTVTKKISKSAVKRNRIKRRLRAAAAQVLPAYAKNSCDYVLIGREATATRPFETLCEDIKWCLRKMEFDA